MATYPIIIPEINPIRLNSLTASQINNTTIVARPDLMLLNTEYQRGIYAVEDYYPDWVKNRELSLQIEAESNNVLAVIIQPSGVSIKMTQTDITPAGWVGYTRFKFTGTPVTEGIHYILLFVEVDDPDNPGSKIDVRFRSDDFKVSSNENKGLIEIKFKNSENKFNFVFDDYYTMFYTGQFRIAAGEMETSVQKTDTGTNKLNSDYIGSYDIAFTDIHQLLTRGIVQQLRCDSILMNGIECITEDNIDIEPTEKSVIYNINASLLEKTNDGSRDFS